MYTNQQNAGERLKMIAEQLAEEVTLRQYERQPDLRQRFGPSGIARTRQDSLYHLRYLAQSVSLESPLLFIHYIIWLKVLLMQYKITAEDLRINLELMKDAITAEVKPPDREVILSYLEMGMYHMRGEESVPSFLQPDRPYYREAEQYLGLLLDGQRRQAAEFIMRLYDDGIPVQDIYLHLFQQSQYEIGRLWQLGRITVAQEHFCTACTQSIISQLYPRWIQAQSGRKRLVATGVGEELHEIGLRMLTDFFEMEGWNTFYLGSNMPAESLIRYLKEQPADLLAVSVTMTFHVSEVVRLIGMIRSHGELDGLKIMVGGMPFNIDRDLWKKVGADGYAPDAGTALEVAEQLIPGTRRREN
ncbi:cobalamin-binding protein [Paenibacillus sp. FSL R7-0273]|uniref:cobalamin B12-binding domain-containing protein n=1 Tax=Paenibacillus sp. FSL R7-0273 TaxID=1536772 RepID=UPI0004F73035|nr:cobalamin-dependent protein [Paenibacillus sp. FSL R7-0273]AIQ45320.1 cobalamin-binding protein [Paenibacillus sp. FSL R7-0273]OMF84006.1 cobalamin-binding protein [Paenibacillus sp. FSL R7-0273]